VSAEAALAVIGHNSESVGQMVEAEPAIVYRDDTVLTGLISEIEAEIAAAKRDVSTKAGREAIASLAYQISRRKTPILDAGKKLTEDWRKKTATVNATKSEVEKQFDALRDKARAPLDAWETAEKSRVAHVETVMSTLRQAAAVPASYVLQDFDEDIEMVNRTVIDDSFGDQRDEAEDAKVEALTALRAGRANFIKAEEERAELARLRAAEEERERKEREAEAARQAAEAERERTAAAAKRAAEEAAARVQAEADAAIAEERRKAREAEETLAAEQQRQRDAKAAEERAAAEEAAATAARQANIEHRSKIMREAKEAIMTCGPTEGMAKQIVLAICAGTIPHTSISF
jgi:colicin import membrane protein